MHFQLYFPLKSIMVVGGEKKISAEAGIEAGAFL